MDKEHYTSYNTLSHTNNKHYALHYILSQIDNKHWTSCIVQLVTCIIIPIYNRHHIALIISAIIVTWIFVLYIKSYG